MTLIRLQITAKKITDIINELADLMKERNVDLAKAFELVNGGKISKGYKEEINWEPLTDEFINDERGNRRDITKRNLIKRMDRTLQSFRIAYSHI